MRNSTGMTTLVGVLFLTTAIAVYFAAVRPRRPAGRPRSG